MGGNFFQCNSHRNLIFSYCIFNRVFIIRFYVFLNNSPIPQQWTLLENERILTRSDKHANRLIDKPVSMRIKKMTYTVQAIKRFEELLYSIGHLQ